MWHSRLRFLSVLASYNLPIMYQSTVWDRKTKVREGFWVYQLVLYSLCINSCYHATHMSLIPGAGFWPWAPFATVYHPQWWHHKLIYVVNIPGIPWIGPMLSVPHHYVMFMWRLCLGRILGACSISHQENMLRNFEAVKLGVLFFTMIFGRQLGD